MPEPACSARDDECFAHTGTLVEPRDDIHRLFHPTGVALVGALNREADPAEILKPARRRFGDAFYLVDPAGGSVGDVDVFERVTAVPAPTDLAILSPGAGLTEEDVVRDCIEQGVRSLIVTTSAFESVELARRHGIRVLGPNANANLFDEMPPPINPRIGKIALITHSGHMGRVIFQASPHGVAFSRWVPTGNEADLEAADFIEYFAYDGDTAVIAGYFEGFHDGAKLRRALAAAATQGKPVVMIKIGRHEVASRMATSHTAHLTGSDAVVDGLFKQYGVIRVDDVDELIETSAFHAKVTPRPAGPRVALYGISGGAVALMAEHAEANGVPVPVLSVQTQRSLHEVLPAHLSVENPVDNGNLYRSGTVEDRRRIFDLIGADDAVDMVLCALTGVLPGITDDFAGDILNFVDNTDKPVAVTWNTWEMSVPAYDAIVQSGLPIFRSFRSCFRTINGYFDQKRRLEAARSRPPYDGPPRFATGESVRTLDAAETSALLARHGVPIPRETLVSTRRDAIDAASELGFPVVMKVPLVAFPHKSDVGLVLTGLSSPDKAAGAYDELVRRARELAPGDDHDVLVQEQVGAGVELIVGSLRDSVFGPTIVLGMGGTLTEVLRDVAVRPLPVLESDIIEMIGELRAAPALNGFRGSRPVDLAAVVRVVQAVAALTADGSVVELDLNPLIAGPGGIVAVDCTIVVEESACPGQSPARADTTTR